MSAPFLGPWIGSKCTGYGGLDLAVMEVYGAQLAWCADNDLHVKKILDTRYPDLGDLTSVDWSAIPRVDIVTAGFPCQDISYAGRHAGMRKDTRSGLWFTIADALRVLLPGLVIVENVAALRSRGLDRVLGDLAALGYDTAWTCLRASDVGACHRRERLFVLAAHPDRPRPPRRVHAAGSEGGRPCGEPAGRGLRLPAADTGGVQPQRRREPADLAGPPIPPAAAPGDAIGDRDQASPHPESERHGYGWPPAGSGLPTSLVGGPAAYAEGLRWGEGLAAPDRLQGQPDPAGDRQPAWGPYEPAIRRWEHILGRPVPAPTELGTRGQPRLSARFVEWLMGIPDGWVTGIDLPRIAQMRALGNGVVPQQAAAAIRHLDEVLYGQASQTGGLR